jgi:dTDP-4-dehydrorhamnose reductase
MLTILVTGANGLLGQKIIYGLRNRDGIRCISTSIGANRMAETSGYIYHALDITDQNAVAAAFELYQPDAVINTAAMTNVDACEIKKEQAYLMNVASVEFLAVCCKKYKTHLVHLSTDFVFDGEHGPYIETDQANPLSYYAQTKFDAENLIVSSGIKAAILRTIIIYGVVDDQQRSNVVLWTMNSLRSQKEITVINDQFRSPTLAEDLADACINAVLLKREGIYHVSGRETMNILDICRITAEFFNLDQKYIKPISSASLNQPAKRPPVTGFIISKAEKELNFHPHSFIEGLEIVQKQLAVF